MTDLLDERPLLALSLGDPAGIGPEITKAAIENARVRAAARLVVLGPAVFCPADVELAAHIGDLSGTSDVTWIDTGGKPDEFAVGEARAASGEAALSALRAGHELAKAGIVDALVTGPVNKQALHMAGERIEGQTELLGRWCEVTRYEMLAVSGPLRVMLLTRHMPLRQAIEAIVSGGAERVLDRLRLLASALEELGIEHPRLALAGLNPHAGEGGLLGTEDLEHLEPAVQRARDEGLDVAGPVSPDTVFVTAARGGYDGVLALYHDQAFIPLKLFAERDGDGVTTIAGLPYLRVSPVHGTAFDIAGRGIASPGNLIAALEQAARWAVTRRTTC